MRHLGAPALLESPGQKEVVSIAGAGVSGSGLGQQRLQKARRGQIIEEFQSQTREQVTEQEVSRTKV